MRYEFFKFLILLFFSFPFFGKAMCQNVTEAQNFQKEADSYIANTFYPLSYLGDFQMYGNSQSLNLEMTFLGLDPVQKENYISYLKKEKSLYMELKGIHYDYVDAKNDLERKKVRDREKELELQIKNVPVNLKTIFGDEIYKRYSDFILWEYFSVQNGSEKTKKEWESIESLNDQELKDAGIVNEVDRKKCLEALYQDYQDFVECRQNMANGKQPRYSHKLRVYSADEREKYVQQFIDNRKNRISDLEKMTLKIQATDKFKRKMGFILNTQ